MTPTEFRQALRVAGFNQQEFAQVMGVHRDTIAKRCQGSSHVEPYWAYALMGVIAAHAAGSMQAIIASIPPTKNPNTEEDQS